VKQHLLCLTAVVAVLSLTVQAQAPDVRRQFEAGQYQAIVDAVGPDASPSDQLFAAFSAQKLGATDRMVEFLRRLSDRPEDDSWRFVGMSAGQLIDQQDDAALASAQRAVELNGESAEAHYQLGLVLAKRQDWDGAATAFDRVSTLNPSLAYAYYYGGLSHYRAGRPDQMAVRFEQFLTLAPEAPERPEVVQTMRAIRGR